MMVVKLRCTGLKYTYMALERYINECHNTCYKIRLSITKILFPVQRVAKIEASRAAAIFFLLQK